MNEAVRMGLANSRDLPSAGFWSVIRTLPCVRRRGLTLLAISVVLASGCSAYRMKSAMDLPEARIATINGTENIGFFFLIGSVGGHRVEILSIDGESPSGVFGGIAVGPGAHVARFVTQHAGMCGMLGCGFFRACSGDLLFEAQAGKRYTLEADTDREPVEVLLKDKQTDTLVAKSACKESGTSKP